jgi:aspartyl-tRNA(Asn)/glutamyl-tRNA(Gln) amidotransferase subunit C
MRIDKDLLKNIATSSRLNLTDAELKEFLPQLQEIFKLFSKLDEVNTDKVSPSFQPIDVNDILRDDQIGKCLTIDEVFKGVKNRQDNYFKGPKSV